MWKWMNCCPVYLTASAGAGRARGGSFTAWDHRDNGTSNRTAAQTGDGGRVDFQTASWCTHRKLLASPEVASQQCTRWETRRHGRSPGRTSEGSSVSEFFASSCSPPQPPSSSLDMLALVRFGCLQRSTHATAERQSHVRSWTWKEVMCNS